MEIKIKCGSSVAFLASPKATHRFRMLFQGIWVGLLIGSVLQTVILFVILVSTKWQKEVCYL
jgi:MATE family multidrug resistance protein